MCKQLKYRVHRLYKQHRKALVIGLILLLLGFIGGTIAKVFWTQTIHHNLDVIGIEADLLVPTVDGFLTKAHATDLTNNKVGLTIYAENFYDIWLNITFTSDAEGLAVTASGQYYQMQGIQNVPMGSPFDIMGYHVIDKTQMMYATNGWLIVTFTFDTELVTTPGAYSADLLFQMGFV